MTDDVTQAEKTPDRSTLEKLVLDMRTELDRVHLRLNEQEHRLQAQAKGLWQHICEWWKQ